MAGFPSYLRGLIWQALCKPEDGFESLGNIYSELLQQTSPNENEIRKDLNRSFPTLYYFRVPEGEGQQRLFKVLKAYSLFEPDIGYCQGLNFVAGILLTHVNRKKK